MTASWRLRHGALDDVSGEEPGAARLTDRQRLAVLLQAVALLGHLERAGGRLAAGWRGATVSARGLLGGLGAEEGLDDELPQRRAERLLLSLFASRRSIAGRGQARRAARLLLARWREELDPVAGDRMVAEVLTAAPFLWERSFGGARRALAAAVGDPPEPWVAGPGRFRRRALEECDDLTEVRALLAAPDAVRLWRRARGGRDPVELAAEGRWRQAVDHWTGEGPTTPDERYEMARALYAVGRFASAKDMLHGLRRPTARVLRLGCQLRMGELAAAKRGLAAWEGRRQSEECRVELAAVAIRLFASLGEPEAARPWIERALAVRDAALAHRARLLAGEAAWDRKDLDSVERRLAETAEVAEDADLGWRRRHLQGLLAMASGDAAGVVEHLQAALGDRRRLRPFEAAGLWNDLAIGRSMRGDLAGAERALGHVVRLSRDSEGDRRLTLALCNLAEIRLRRGRLDGVGEVLERSSKANLQAGNWRGWAQDQELRARYELVRGRPGAALACVERTVERLDEHDVDWRRGELAVLAARSLGWLGRPAAAREALSRTSRRHREELEPEERAPLWALAGDCETALVENGDGPCERLWRRVLAGDEEIDWSALERLEPYRAARVVLDLSLLGAARPPAEWRRRAAGTLREVGAESFAERLDAGGEGPARAVVRYLESAEAAPVERLSRLLRALSPDARLAWRDADSEVELVPAAGGGEVLERPLHGGVLRCEAPRIGASERLALALASRDLPSKMTRARPAPPTRRYGMIGRSAALVAAVDRLTRLAPRDLPILVEGETGTGKELAARCVHAASRRASEAFLPVNCAALAENLLLSELFGHVRGAFTGAERDRAGIFEAARRGTVFLDEIGDLPLPAQGKLLRVLQEGEVRRVGESVARPVDVRIVAATHRDLEAMVDGGSFREDLYYRLSVGRVALPPLRERGQDLFLLAEHFLGREADGGSLRLSPGARRALAAHSWPGNVRELRNVLTVAATLAEDGVLTARHLDLPRPETAPRSGYHERLEGFRRRLVGEALEAARGNQAEAARRLGLSRQALSYLVRHLDIG